MRDNATKNKIIEAMYGLVAEKGYDKTSIGQISEVIGIKKASVYYYFKSKEEIFLQMVRKLYQNSDLDASALFKEEMQAGCYREELIAMGEKFIDSYFENPNLRKVYAEIDIQTARIPALKAFVKASDEDLHRFLMQCLAHGVAVGAFQAGFDAKLNAQILYTVLTGIDQAILYELPIEPKAVWKEVICKLFERKAF